MTTANQTSNLVIRTLVTGLVMITLSGCASNMSELIAEANESGDWTAVDQRFDSQEEARAAQQSCGSRQTLHCTTTLNETSCGCVSSQALWDRPAAMTIRQRGDRF